jgi:hypothetical protein
MFKHKINCKLILFFIPIVLSGCFSMSTLQTARTTPKDKGDLGMSIGLSDFKNKSEQSSIDYLPLIEGTFRCG